IPTFLLIRDLHLYDSFWVYIIPSLFGFYNCIIFMSFFRTLPPALEESAMIDGANEFQQFIKIILPLSKPILATIALFTAVGHWNDYFTGVIYIQNPDLIPIQTYLYRIVAEAGSVKIQTNVQGLQERANSTQALKLATMVVTTLPIVCVYPFLQKYFVKGVMIGAVKG
ncbi:MAG TPA: carbohydrate ABC transporter permease, partial [Candidatus Caccousia avistercoris]|nr:carbohydrate ABC transporter permease [Candidatus Caccousia avistercoris]